MNIVLTVIFTVEMFLKKIAFGALFGTVGENGPYWRKPWNILDGGVVIVAVIDTLGIGREYAAMKTLRVLRALRPLRVISRSPNLKLVVNTLFQSVPELCNLLVVAGLFFLIFGLFSVASFKGGFYTCQVVFDGDIAASDDVGVDNVAAAILDEDSGVSWLCVDSNPQSPSFGAAWPAPAAVLGVAEPYGKSCDDFLAAIQDFPGGNLPPPSASAKLLFWHRASSDTPICVTSCPADNRAAEGRDRPAGCPGPVTMDNVPDITDGSSVFDPLQAMGVTSLQVPAALHPDGRRYEPGEISFLGPYPEWQAASTQWLMPCGD